jgi:hypothetical protein
MLVALSATRASSVRRGPLLARPRIGLADIAIHAVSLSRRFAFCAGVPNAVLGARVSTHIRSLWQSLYAKHLAYSMPMHWRPSRLVRRIRWPSHSIPTANRALSVVAFSCECCFCELIALHNFN